MADNPQTEPNADAAQGGDGGQQTDYKALYEQLKADSRKWEERAKANKAKADEYDQLKGGEESIEDRIAKLEAENQAMKDAETRHALVAKVAKSVGLPESLVENLSGSDEETLTAQAQAVADLKPKGAPSAPEAGKFPRENSSTKTNAERFGDLIEQALGR